MNFLNKIRSKIRKVIRVDRTTATAERGQFTRLSVEIDLSKPLLSKFWLKGRIWQIQYEGLRMICYHCGKIGHKEENCVKEGNNPELLRQGDPCHVHEVSPPHHPIEQSDYGSWMLVKKPVRRRAPRQEKQVVEAGKVGSNLNRGEKQIPNPKPRNETNMEGSRFNILQNAVNEEGLGEESVLRHDQRANSLLDSREGNMERISSEFSIVDLGKSSQSTQLLSKAGNSFILGNSSKGNNLSSKKSL